MFKRSYRLRLTIIFLILVLIPLSFMGISGNYALKHFIMDQYHRNTVNQIAYESAVIDKWFQDRIAILRSIAQPLQIYEDYPRDLVKMNQYLERQMANAPEFFNIYFTLEDDGLSPAALKSKPGIDFRQRPWYIHAKQMAGAVVSEPYKDIITGMRVITISLPFYDSNHLFMGVIGGDFSFEEVQRLIGQSKVPGMNQQIVFDQQGNLLWTSDSTTDLEAILSKIDLHKMTIHKNKPYEINYGNDQKQIAFLMELPSISWYIVGLSNDKDFHAYTESARLIFIAIAAISILIMIVSVFLANKQVAKPMIELRDAVKDVETGNFSISIQRNYDDEVGEVIDAFNQMAATIRDNYHSMTEQACRLMEGNQRLQDMNEELEASYEQLQATSEQLNYSEQKYKLLIENISDLVWVMDEDGKITYINDEVERMLAYQKSQVLGEPLWNMMCPLHQYEECTDILEQCKQEDFEKKDLWMLAADGERRVIVETSTRRIYKDGVFIGVQGIGRDVTEYVRIKQQIIKQNEELTALNEISASLTGTLSTVRMDKLLNAIVNKVVEVMDVAICSVRLLDHMDRLEFKTAAGALSHLVCSEPIGLDEDLMGVAVKEKRTVMVDHIESRFLTKYNRKMLESNRLKHVVVTPLRLGEDVIGVMLVGSERRLEESNLRILKSLSNHAAVTIEKSRLYEALKQAYVKTIKALAMAVEAKDTYTQGHSIRVAQYATLIGTYMGLTSQDIESLEVAGILHDIGKIGISEAILTKPGKLSNEEFDNITQHPTIGSRILDPIGLSEEIMQAILLHHKRYDLRGYPVNVEVDELPLFARIIGVADAFDAMISKRSYKEPMSVEEAMKELIFCKGTHFSPDIVDVMEDIYREDIYLLKEIAGA